MAGWFGLATPCDLLRKLHSDYAAFLSEPTNAFLAFNFFVTANSLLDWVYPGRGNPRFKDLRDSEVLLQVCDHLACGLKHFELEDSRHKSVSKAGRGGGFFGADFFGSRLFAGRHFGRTSLIVRLNGDAAKALGGTIEATALARKVLDFWENRAELANCPKPQNAAQPPSLASP
jgi:hypothetical protein